MSGALSQIELTSAEIAGLPEALRRKIEAAFGPADKPTGEWMLVGAKTPHVAAILDRTLASLLPIATAHAAALQERHIEKLLEIIAEDLPRARVEAELDLDNARLRAAYLAETPLLTAAEVRQQSGLTPRNKSEPASRWKREGKLFALRKGSVDLYPAFQFEDGTPKPVMGKILAALPGEMTPWQTALWFASGNGWLDGEEPQNCLARPEEVIEAAKRLAEPNIG